MHRSDPNDVPLMTVHALKKHFPVGRQLFSKEPKAWLRAVDGVDLQIHRGRTLGLVGESGCGKSTLGRLLIRLLEPTSGAIKLDGEEISNVSARKLMGLRKRFQMVFQDPMGSLDPRMKIGESVAEPMYLNGIGNRREKVAEMLEAVSLSPEIANRFPHEFSGGQRQRICIARALTLEPDLIVADEPVAALDVSVQAQIVNLFQDIQQKMGLGYVFISHDLGVVRHIADDVAVMYLGKIVEQGSVKEVLDAPAHPYTRALVSAILPPRPTGVRFRPPVSGDLPSPINIPKGCRFASRCPMAKDLCREEEPVLRRVANGQHAACHFT
ncbi:ABC transporter ATP-binding protein [Pseudoruegeria sp. SK021]|uniref:ABC transporter ATP-binding protein n=1 Tax=Pseudoruegeria sp. SK021 TaxID=1933035 RepID=UPI000A23B335|nr:oligopeptide/dipeptide ABC transporter ATP-binding protein [Pseudoruegeria sp. SK021]OSP53467.1 peptide ABC transporter ATP-binding protein [Pseudoruegeria sp. SK021]